MERGPGATGQPSFASYEFVWKKRLTRPDSLLAEKEQVMSCGDGQVDVRRRPRACRWQACWAPGRRAGVRLRLVPR